MHKILTFNIPNSSTIYLMKSATVPSVAVKGNGITLGITNGSSNVSMCTYFDGTSEYFAGNGVLYGSAVGTQISSGSAWTRLRQAIGVTMDASKSGIITNTGTMSNITSRLIIKY